MTNIEGVINRFENAIETVIRGEEGEVRETAEKILERLQIVKDGKEGVSLELLDPRGRSQIIHPDAISRQLEDDEKELLESGPEIPVFDLG